MERGDGVEDVHDAARAQARDRARRRALRAVAVQQLDLHRVERPRARLEQEPRAEVVRFVLTGAQVAEARWVEELVEDEVGGLPRLPQLGRVCLRSSGRLWGGPGHRLRHDEVSLRDSCSSCGLNLSTQRGWVLHRWSTGGDHHAG